MTRLRSGPLAAWATAWLGGRAASDEVIRAVTGDDAPHQVLDVDGDRIGLGELLIRLRRRTGSLAVVLPVAGDVRGVPGPTDFRAAALEAGEAVVADNAGYVPEVTDYSPSSAPTTVVWRGYFIDIASPDPLPVRQARVELAEAMRECASALTAAQVAGSERDVADALADARRAGERLDLPPGHPAEAVQLVAQAERLALVLDLAVADPRGGAVDRAGMTARAEALRPLATAIRRARVAGWNAA